MFVKYSVIIKYDRINMTVSIDKNRIIFSSLNACRGVQIS